MQLAEVRAAIIQDDPNYKIMLKKILGDQLDYSAFYDTLPSGLAVIREIGTGNPNRVNVLLLDENMTPNDHSGSDGQKFFGEIELYDMNKLLDIINISSEPRLHLKYWVGPFLSSLEDLLIKL